MTIEEIDALSIKAYKETSWRSHLCKEAFFNGGFHKGYEQAIENACAWLESHYDVADYCSIKEYILDFKNAMIKK